MQDIYGPIRTAIARIDAQVRELGLQADAIKSEVAKLLDKRQALASALDDGDATSTKTRRRSAGTVSAEERAELIAEVRRAVAAGESWASVGRRLGRCESTLRRCFELAGEPPPETQNRGILNRRRRAELAPILAREHAAGARVAELAHRHGIDPTTVLAWVRWAESCDDGKACDDGERLGVFVSTPGPKDAHKGVLHQITQAETASQPASGSAVEPEDALVATTAMPAPAMGFRVDLRQRQVLELHTAGKSPGEIATELGLSSASVRGHLGAARKAELRAERQAPAAPAAPARAAQPEPMVPKRRHAAGTATQSRAEPELEISIGSLALTDLRRVERSGRPRTMAQVRTALDGLGVHDAEGALQRATSGLSDGEKMRAALRLYDTALRHAREACGSLGVVR